VWLAALCLAMAAPARADIVNLKDGDRITGKVTSQTERVVRVQTAYGRLVIPKTDVESIVRGGVTERVVAGPGAPPPAPKGGRHRMILVVTGKAFWQAWEGKGAGDPGLRMEVRLDEDVVASYVDPKPDPQEIPRAVVNTFSFLMADVVVQPGPGTVASLPEVRPGRIVLKIDVPPAATATRRLRVAYQVNEGTPDRPAWRDMVDSSQTVALSSSGPTFVQVRQERGQMEFTGFPRRKMRGVESFQVELSPE
jgi:hypothetical protein